MSDERATASMSLAAWLRLAWRVPVCAAGTLVLASLWFGSWPLRRISPAAQVRLRRATLQGWARWALRCFGIRLRTRGRLPREGVLLVANHVSYVDIAVLAARVDAVFVSMSELRAWPFFGPMASSLGTVFLDRSRKRELVDAMREMQDWIARGYTVVLFPEGTNSHGERVLEFRPSLLEPAAAGRIPVACATLGYATRPPDPPASLTVAWVSEPFVPHALRVSSRRAIDAELVLHPELEVGDERKVLARLLHARVASAFVPLA
jgi:1-acyl-sn-glycerol-3-phosphate acyltransferase